MTLRCEHESEEKIPPDRISFVWSGNCCIRQYPKAQLKAYRFMQCNCHIGIFRSPFDTFSYDMHCCWG